MFGEDESFLVFAKEAKEVQQLPRSKPAPRGVSPRSCPQPLQERNAGKVESVGAEGSSSTLREKTVIPEEHNIRQEAKQDEYKIKTNHVSCLKMKPSLHF